MHMLRDDRVVQHTPTQYPTSEELQLAGINFKAFDLGGHEIARRVWKDYYAQVSTAHRRMHTGHAVEKGWLRASVSIPCCASVTTHPPNASLEICVYWVASSCLRFPSE